MKPTDTKTPQYEEAKSVLREMHKAKNFSLSVDKVHKGIRFTTHDGGHQMDIKRLLKEVGFKNILSDALPGEQKCYVTLNAATPDDLAALENMGLLSRRASRTFEEWLATTESKPALPGFSR